MKKILTILSFCLLIQTTMAKNVEVEALSDFSTANPPEIWKIKIVEGFVTNDGKAIHSNSIIEGKITEVVSPKRLKRSASFKFIPLTYYNPYDNEIKEVNENFVGKYSKISNNKKNIAKSTAITASNILISPFIGLGVGIVEGVAKNEEGNRAKSAVVSAYKSTPISYIEKGEELEFKKGEVFIMNFKLNNEENVSEKNMQDCNYEIFDEEIQQ
ncbi:hypothetical protein IJX73_00650 [bacterium]|nr:hypothetical protein [bacterium]MBQ9149419.1 hypothetical protein [bacterium]